MGFRYTPKTEEECQKALQYPMLEPGIYDFQVISAEYKTSSKGNPMIALKLCVWNEDGKQFHIFDYLVATEKMEWKTKHFCDSVGLSKEYESGAFNEDLCANRCGKASIIYQAGQKKPDGSYYADKNAVEDYVVTDKGSLKYDPNAQGKEKGFFNDDIPF